jgi:hypothetical protein
MSVFCPVKGIQHDHQHRRNLTIASLLNDVSVEPLSDASNKEIPPWDGPLYSYQAESSPSCSSSTTMDESDTSKFSCSPLSSRSTSPVDLWNYTQPNAYSGSIIASSFSKAKRKRILPHQYTRLMKMFEETDTPSSEIRAQLASELDMTNREVQVTFF